MEHVPIHEILELSIRAENTTSNSTSSAQQDSNARPPVFKAVGIILAVSSGLFIGVSFVLKKKGLLRANSKYNEEAGEGYGYLRNWMWWSGMTLMIIGEICNFVAYAFVDAILVTPLGALSVVVTTILSAIFLKERLSFVGKVGCFMCIVGSVVIVLNAPEQSSVKTIQDMQHFVIAPGFLSYAGVIIVGCVFIALWAGPRYGKKSMLVFLSICSLVGGLSVVATQGLGAAIITQIGGTPQFNQWFLYVLLVFVICTLLTEIIYLNKALNIFNAALVTPTYYVYFTSATIVSSAILFQGFKGSAMQITTVVLGFLQICAGVVLLQLSKSAKDVPDAAVFKGDLDQVRTVAEQEDPESEPRADTIRGTAGILRSFSKARMQREASEAKRLQEEHLEPIGENEQVEWDGIRRRKTTIGSLHSSTGTVRARTVHPPLGMSAFPPLEDNDNNQYDDDESTGFFPDMRRRAQSILHPRSGSRHTTSSTGDDKIPGVTTVPLSEIPSSRSGNNLRDDQSRSSSTSRPHVFGLPPGLQQDTSYKSPSAPASERNVSTPGPTPPPHAHAKRTFSFQNVFTRPRTAEENRPTSSRSSLFTRKRPGGTEEESLGLVHGEDSTGSRHQGAYSDSVGTLEEEESVRESYESMRQRDGTGDVGLNTRTGRDVFDDDDADDDDDDDDVTIGAKPSLDEFEWEKGGSRKGSGGGRAGAFM